MKQREHSWCVSELGRGDALQTTRGRGAVGRGSGTRDEEGVPGGGGRVGQASVMRWKLRALAVADMRIDLQRRPAVSWRDARPSASPHPRPTARCSLGQRRRRRWTSRHWPRIPAAPRRRLSLTTTGQRQRNWASAGSARARARHELLHQSEAAASPGHIEQPLPSSQVSSSSGAAHLLVNSCGVRPSHPLLRCDQRYLACCWPACAAASILHVL